MTTTANPIKQYKRHRSVDELRAKIEGTDLTLNTSNYDEGGDHISVSGYLRGSYFEIFFSTFNGRFFGQMDSSLTAISDGIFFNSDESRDNEPWFSNLLEIFYL